MATNDFIGFASSGSANIMSQADYAAAAEQGNGVQPGMASSRLANKAWRQGANMAAAVGELIKNHGNDALDNGDLVTLYNALLASTASTTLAGLMSAADKNKLDSLISTDATPTAAGYMSAADKTRLDSVILTNATQSAAGYMSGADKTKLDSLISTNATPTAAGYMSAADKTKLDRLIVHNTLLPVGAVMWLSGNTVPDGCLVADGAAVSRTTYSELFSAIGTTWGEGDGSTTFNLPDARGRVPEGAQTAGGYNAPGLPNITGSVIMHSADSGTNIQRISGAFYDNNTLSSYRDGGNKGSGATSIPSFTLNASRSSSIYGASSTVQPASVKLLPVIVYRSKRADN